MGGSDRFVGLEDGSGIRSDPFSPGCLGRRVLPPSGIRDPSMLGVDSFKHGGAIATMVPKQHETE
jgi:hypothetical protein